MLKKNKNMVRKIVNFREFTLSFLPKDCKFKLVGLNNHEQHDYTSAILTWRHDTSFSVHVLYNIDLI